MINLSAQNVAKNVKMENNLVIGCNYHTTWQSDPRMRFILVEINGTKARLKTRMSGKDFWTNVSDLIFIETSYNKNKAKNLCSKK